MIIFMVLHSINFLFVAVVLFVFHFGFRNTNHRDLFSWIKIDKTKCSIQNDYKKQNKKKQQHIIFINESCFVNIICLDLYVYITPLFSINLPWFIHSFIRSRCSIIIIMKIKWETKKTTTNSFHEQQHKWTNGIHSI